MQPALTGLVAEQLKVPLAMLGDVLQKTASQEVHGHMLFELAFFASVLTAVFCELNQQRQAKAPSTGDMACSSRRCLG